MVKKVLIVDDSIVMSKAIKMILDKAGLQVFMEPDGAKALEAAKNNRVDVIILDLMMPGVSGKEVLKMLKSDPVTKMIPVLLLTARIDVLRWDDELKAAESSMQKPFDNHELVSEIKRLAGN
jgi:two-component system alkaline phosphatase synthesis response regulator PhoP